MTRPTVSEVRSFLLEHFSFTIAANGLNPTEIGDDFDLLEAGVIDSLGVLEMISAVEQRFKITVDFEPMDPAELTLLDKFSSFVAENAVARGDVS
ncbi:MAG: acyl carrier protein [Candidatus Aminicenantales bacterium]